MSIKMKNLKILQYNAITWIITGCVLVLIPIFIWWAQDNISRQKRAIDRLLLEKGATSILLFEVFSRADLQDSIERASMNRDISHIIITDSKGNIKNHRDSDQIGNKYAKDLDLASIVNPAQFRPGQFRPDQLLRSRKITGKDGKPVFEIYRRFMPWSIRSMLPRQGRLPQPSRDARRMMQENLNPDEDPQSLRDRDRRRMMEIMDEDPQIIGALGAALLAAEHRRRAGLGAALGALSGVGAPACAGRAGDAPRDRHRAADAGGRGASDEQGRPGGRRRARATHPPGRTYGGREGPGAGFPR